jgi:prepilin-type N-terminal cleavage/methylation domain-containing protein
MKKYNTLRAFTLVEVMVGIAVFALVMAGAAGVMLSVQDSWQRQSQMADLVQNGRWAMEFLTNEIRGASGANDNPGGITRGMGLRIPDPPPANNKIFYWRGDQTSDSVSHGYNQYLYRAVSSNMNFAYGLRQELSHFIVDNPDLVDNGTGNATPDGIADPIFIVNGYVVTIELTLRSNPALPAGAGNQNYTLRTRVRVRD